MTIRFIDVPTEDWFELRQHLQERGWDLESGGGLDHSWVRAEKGPLQIRMEYDRWAEGELSFPAPQQAAILAELPRAFLQQHGHLAQPPLTWQASLPAHGTGGTSTPPPLQNRSAPMDIRHWTVSSVIALLWGLITAVFFWWVIVHLGGWPYLIFSWLPAVPALLFGIHALRYYRSMVALVALALALSPLAIFVTR